MRDDSQSIVAHTLTAWHERPDSDGTTLKVGLSDARDSEIIALLGDASDAEKW